MKKNLYIITGITIYSTCIFNACRSTDTDNTITKGASSLNINLMGTEFSNSAPSPNASINRNTAAIPVTQTHSTIVTPSTVIIAELSPSSDSSGAMATISNGISSTAATPGNTLGAGVKFRVIAYRQSNGTYQAHQDYTVGQTAVPMMLDNGTAYNIVVYSLEPPAFLP